MDHTSKKLPAMLQSPLKLHLLIQMMKIDCAAGRCFYGWASIQIADFFTGGL